MLALTGFSRVLAVSSLYETEPVEFIEQPWFLNCCVAIETELTPTKVLKALLEIELAMGRRREAAANDVFAAKGPRKIDIDIVLFGAMRIATVALTIPHPAMHLRRFVLEPLAEIAPGAVHPVMNQSVAKLLAELPAGSPVVNVFRTQMGGLPGEFREAK